MYDESFLGSTEPAPVRALQVSPRRKSLPKWAINLIVVSSVTLPVILLILYWLLSSQSQKKVAPVAQFNPRWAINQIDSDYLASQQQMNLFLNGNDAGEMGQSSRLIRAEAQRLALTVDKFRADKKHPCCGQIDTVYTGLICLLRLSAK